MISVMDSLRHFFQSAAISCFEPMDGAKLA
jgi:hypothetical protein